MTQLSVIVPTYNESANIEPLVKKLAAALKNIDHEIIIVDDDSPDQTWWHAQEISKTNSRVRVIRRVNNPGLAASVLEGFEHANGHVLACMDGDLQHDPDVLPTMLTELDREFSLIVASRYVQQGSVGDWSSIRKLQSSIASKLAKALLHVTLHDPMSGFFMMRRLDFLDVRQRLRAQGFKILLEIVARLETGAIAEVPYRFRPRIAGDSKLSSRVAFSYLAQLVRLRRALGTSRL
jgi:dolichol-phosphate mannosyltransferase